MIFFSKCISIKVTEQMLIQLTIVFAADIKVLKHESK